MNIITSSGQVESTAPFNQRWREGRSSYRPARECINPLRYEVAAIPGDAAARAFIEREHYSHRFPAARRRYGLYRTGGRLVGVAVFGQPCNQKTISCAFPWIEEKRSVVELSRFVLLDDVEANGETFFLAQCFDLLRQDEKQDFAGVLSFSDPVPRRTEDGRVIHAGHIGGIYQAFNGVFTGRGTARKLRVFKKTGTVLSDRSAQKLRKMEKGWRSVVEELESQGAEPLGGDVFDEARRRAWLDRWTRELTGRLDHPGNLRYIWGLNRRTKRQLPRSLPYPKWTSLPFELKAAA